MATIQEIPLTPAQACVFTVTLNDVLYNMRLTYNTAQEGCWILDIGDENQVMLVAGIPLVSNIDLLAQYTYLGFGGSLVLTTDRNAAEVPRFEDLGVIAHLYFITPS